MVQKSGDHQLRLVVEIPLFTKKSYIQTVLVWDFWTINCIWDDLWLVEKPSRSLIFTCVNLKLGVVEIHLLLVKGFIISLGPELSRQTLVSPIYLQIRNTTICGWMFPKICCQTLEENNGIYLPTCRYAKNITKKNQRFIETWISIPLQNWSYLAEMHITSYNCTFDFFSVTTLAE